MRWTTKDIATLPRVDDKIRCADGINRTVKEVLWIKDDHIVIKLSGGGEVVENANVADEAIDIGRWLK